MSSVSSSSRVANSSSVPGASLQLWEYRDAGLPAAPSAAAEPAPAPAPAPPPGVTEVEVAARIQQALAEAEGRWAAAAAGQEARREEQLRAALEAFAAERERYFREAETEVVQLALAVARKILGREAALDPDLLGALVRMALDRMGAGPAVKLHLPPAELARWREGNASLGSPYRCELAPDPSLAPGDCRVETDLGRAHLGLERQFKEIEDGMLDLLRLRPGASAPVSTPSMESLSGQAGEEAR